ncbi:MAG: J domain-containing protein [Clostridia bacterium]|nr:J domain-containing protein [Clostridia bacterium]
MSDPYQVLGISPDATDEQIKNAYREKAKIYHEGAYENGPLAEVAAKKLQELDDAYDRIIAQRRSGGYQSSSTHSSSAYSGSGYSNTSYTPPTYAAIREKIRRNDLDGAQTDLDSIPDMSRIAEWYYLQGMIQQKKGWANAAYENYERAYRMDPSNAEYSRAFQTMNSHRNGGYRTSNGRNSDSDCNFCSVCQGLICADCCCECFGGDIIPCC